MANKDDGVPVKHKFPAFKVLMTSGFFLAAFAWVFQMQGRAYRSGYLGYFGLEYADFPMSAGDLQWLTVVGWTEVTAKLFDGLWEYYVDNVLVLGTPVASVLLLLLWTARLVSGRWERIKSWLSGSRRRVTTAAPAPILWVWARVKEVFAVALAAFLSFSFAPALILVFSFLVLSLALVLLVPFERMGANAAEKRCMQGLAALNEIRLNQDYSDLIDARQLHCSEERCAVISNGRIWVVPRSSVVGVAIAAVAHEGGNDAQGMARDSFCKVRGKGAGA